MKILLVEDDPETVKILSILFEITWPHADLVLASNGASGIHLAQTEEPDIIVLDLGLPDMDGLDVCTEIRRYSDVPIVMLTIRDSDADSIKGLEAGADDYVAKPFKPEILKARMRAVLRRTLRSAQGEPEVVLRSSGGWSDLEATNKLLERAGNWTTWTFKPDN